MIDNSVDYRGVKVDKLALMHNIEWVDEFIDCFQPERSKREDVNKECDEMGHMNTWMPKNQTLCMRCGALNIVETQ